LVQLLRQAVSPQLHASSHETKLEGQDDCRAATSLLQLELTQSRQVCCVLVGFPQLRPLEPHADVVPMTATNPRPNSTTTSDAHLIFESFLTGSIDVAPRPLPVVAYIGDVRRDQPSTGGPLGVQSGKGGIGRMRVASSCDSGASVIAHFSKKHVKNVAA
jgi:hypothetical protein